MVTRGKNYAVTVTATHSECDWSASESYDWISLSPGSGSGNGTVSVTVSANTGEARSATITIAGQNHTINQDPAGCSYTIAPTIQSVNYEGETYNVTVTATHSECDWSASENYDWISLSPVSGSGSGTVRVTVAANPGSSRSATITIAGQDHTINQDPAGCSYTIAPTSRSVDNDGETYTVSVTATHSGCDWSASENDDWISLSPHQRQRQWHGARYCCSQLRCGTIGHHHHRRPAPCRHPGSGRVHLRHCPHQPIS